MRQRTWFALFAIVLTFMFSALVVMPKDADARMGRKSSFGFKGSRSMNTAPKSSPSRFSSGQSQRSSQQQQATGKGQQQKKSGMGGMLGGLFGGLLLGGLLGSLFSAGGGLGGLLMMLLLGAGVFFLVKKFMAGRRPADDTAYASPMPHGQQRQSQHDLDEETDSAPMQRQAEAPVSTSQPVETEANAAPAGDSEMEQVMARLMEQDPNFDEFTFIDGAKRCFEMLQSAWSNYDPNQLQGLLTEQMMKDVDAHAQQLIASGQKDVVKDIHFNEAAIVEAWNEQGMDYLTVRFNVSLIEYIEDASGTIVEGDPKMPQLISEYWAFARPEGAQSPNWQLTAIQQP
ncbi:Tim44 domain-containing protein [Magnetococcus sp. PR-3]|uniref:Tim44 domain-containing protein n=1 Tax=Magnetococcus sp. PR-3 TaxID=3120355 RepID=UPI002FCE627E